MFGLESRVDKALKSFEKAKTDLEAIVLRGADDITKRDEGVEAKRAKLAKFEAKEQEKNAKTEATVKRAKSALTGIKRVLGEEDEE